MFDKNVKVKPAKQDFKPLTDKVRQHRIALL